MASSVRAKVNAFYNEHINLKNRSSKATPPPPVKEIRDAASREKKVRALVLSIIVETKGDFSSFFDEIFLKGKYKTQAQLQALDLYQKRTMQHHAQHNIIYGINLLVAELQKTLLTYGNPDNDETLLNITENDCIDMLFTSVQSRIAFQTYQQQTDSLNKLQQQLLVKGEDKDAQNLIFALSQSIMALQSSLLSLAIQQPKLIAGSNDIKASHALLIDLSDYTTAVISQHLVPTIDNQTKITQLRNNIMTHPEYAALDFRKRQMLLNLHAGIALGFLMGLMLTVLAITIWALVPSGLDQLVKAAMYIHQHMSICNSLFYDGIVVPGLIGSAAGMCVGAASTAFTIYKGPKHHECVGLQDELFSAAIDRADAIATAGTAKQKPNVL